MKLTLRTLFSIGTMLAAPPLAAQTIGSEGQRDGDGDIVVTAARSALPASALPLTIDVIDNDALNQQVAISGSVVDAISTLTPSFSPTRQKLSGSGESLRGRSPLYAINGIPQSTPLRDGSRDGFTIDPFFVDRVELIYGSNALQGIGGAGGIVNQVTVGPPSVDGLSGRTLIQGTADDGFHDDGLGGKVAGLLSYKIDRFDATFGAAFEKRGAFYDGHGNRIGIDNVQGETMDSKSWSLFGRLGYAVSDSARLDLILSRYELKSDADYVSVPGDRDIGLPSSTVRGTPPGLPAKNLAQSAALSFTDDNLADGHLVTQIFYSRTRDTFGSDPAPVATFQDASIAPYGTLVDQSQNRSRKIGTKFSYERSLPGWDALTATIGFDTLFDKTEQALLLTGRVWVPPTDFRSLAPFGQLNLALLDGKVRLAGGVRNENVRIKIDDFTTLASYGSRQVKGGSPKFSDTLLNGGAIFEPAQGIRAYVSYAEGYTVPDVGRITRSINRDGVDLSNYLDISPIVSNNREIGVEVKRGPIDASAAYFWSTSKNGQLLVLVNGVFEVQRQRVEIQGLELNLSVKPPVPGLKLSMGYAHLIGRTDGTPDDGIDKVNIDLDGANISPDRLNFAASYDRGPLSARIQTQFYFARRFDYSPLPDFAGNDRSNDFGGYNLTDATVRYQTAFGGITLAVQNLFDKFYIDYNSDTQRPTDDTRFYSGRGRTFTLGWDYRF
ncbi:TonB-dependent receptor [Sphingomonas fennica]